MYKKIFISYDYDRHNNYKNLLLAWKATTPSLRFADNSVDVSINSNDISYIRSVISSSIKDSDIFLLIVGDYTSKNVWVEWECLKAMKLNKWIYVIKTGDYNTPSCLLGYRWMTTFYGFSKENLRRIV